MDRIENLEIDPNIPTWFWQNRQSNSLNGTEATGHAGKNKTKQPWHNALTLYEN